LAHANPTGHASRKQSGTTGHLPGPRRWRDKILEKMLATRQTHILHRHFETAWLGETASATARRSSRRWPNWITSATCRALSLRSWWGP